MDKEQLLIQAENEVELIKQELLDISRYIFDNPELAYNENKASALLEKTIISNGFCCHRGQDELKTALRAQQKNNKSNLTIAFIAEYDALPIGHACGHNLIAASGIGAAIAFSKVSQKFSLPVNIVFLGTPAEEGGGGKIKMLEAGMFDGIDYAMMIHPCDSTMVEDWSLAGQVITFKFYGRGAHCAASPWLGANALAAAMELINMVNAWRSQFRDFSRVFPNITHGGEATNVIPDFAEVKYNIRSDDILYHKEIVEIVKNCAVCAAKAFGVTVGIEESFAYAPIKNNELLETCMAEAFARLGENVIPRYRDHGIGSTDMGNVSQVLPAIHGHMYLAKENTHTESFKAAAGDERGEEYCIKAAKAMAMTAILLMEDRI